MPLVVIMKLIEHVQLFHVDFKEMLSKISYRDMWIYVLSIAGEEIGLNIVVKFLYLCSGDCLIELIFNNLIEVNLDFTNLFFNITA